MVLGPTASGKTALACTIALRFNGEIISADSRQVYRHLDIGTGKDLQEFTVNGHQIPYHLIDVADPAKQFFLHEFQQLLLEAFNSIVGRHKLPIVCGGTGLYLDALQKDFSLTQVPENTDLRNELAAKEKKELTEILLSYQQQDVQHVDLSSTKRIIRGIEIAQHLHDNPIIPKKKPLPYKPLYLGIDIGKKEREEKITSRLQQRFDQGMIDEVRTLMEQGVSYERLQFLGLEYKFISDHLAGKLTYDEMFSKLRTAIFQFAKRQMTWFRRMEKHGVKIHWINDSSSREEFLEKITQLLEIPDVRE